MLSDINQYYKEYSKFIDSSERFLSSEVSPYLTEWEKAGHFPNQAFDLLGKQGYLGILIPEEFGGIGGDIRLAAAWCEVFGSLCAVGFTVAVNMHSLVISHALSRFGSKESKEAILAKAVKGELIGAYAFTEPGAGSDLAGLRTTAVKKGNEWVINGTKIFITNGARADFVLVLTRTDPAAGYKGFTTFVVDTKLPGFKVMKKLDKLGWHSSDTAELSFDNVVVPEHAILGKLGEGWVQASESLTWERLMLSLTSLAGARAAFKAALKYSRERKAFGKYLFEIDIVRGYLSQMYEKIILGRSITRGALENYIQGKPSRALAAAAKRLICEDAIWIADKGLQIHGGYGYTTEFPLERWLRDLRLMTIGGGTTEIMGDIVAREIF